MSNELENNNNEIIIDRKLCKRNIFSLNDSDIQTIWDFVSDFVESTMLKQKGIHIPGLGTFSFNHVKLDIGQNKYVLLQRPLFMLSEKICQNHNLKQNKAQITGSIPVIPLNYSYLMLKSSFTRDQVETCVRELITATNNAIASQNGTELVFTRIGRLQIRNQQVKFKFYKNFISNLDSSGKIMNTMQNRPGTADSVMSERPPTRSFSNTLPLPRIAALNDCQRLPSINELDMFESKNKCCEDSDFLRVEDDSARYSNEEFQSQDDERLMEQEMDFKPNPTFENHPMYIESMNSDDLSTREFNDDNQTEQTKKYNQIEAEDDDQLKPLPTPQPPSKSFLLPEPKKPSSICSNNRPSTSASSICGHPGPAGQDLCYVCYQREKRNVPISFAEQLKEREKEEERVIQAYQNMKDSEHLMKEQDTLLAKKHDSQKISAFNAGVAEAIKSQQKSKDPNMYRSYLFEKRPLTPPKIIKQSQLSSELGKQVERKVTTRKKNEEDEAFMERLEQMQLAEDLAKQRDQYLKDKEKSKDLYKKALDTQVVTKPLPLPKFQPDSEEPVFGKNDVTQEKLIEKRVRAQDILKYQMECAEQKKKEMLMSKLQEQTHEEKVLDKVKHDLIEDRARRYQRALQNRMKLESEWEKAKEEKKERDLIERLKISMPDNILVHEQCDKYSRCAQCKRKTQNMGQSNIWKETYFIPGTRYIY